MTTIRADIPVFTLINTFFVAPGRADELLQVLSEATTAVMSRQPGFISANLHVSADRTRVVNYAQWRSKADNDAMQSNAEVLPHMKRAAEIAEGFEPVYYTVAYVDDIPQGT